MIFLWLLFFLMWPLPPESASAFMATSTSFNVIQGIQSVLSGSTYSPYSTSTSFSQFGAGGEAAVGISTSTTFTNHSGIVSSIGKTKNASGGTSLTFTVDSNSKAFSMLSPGTLSSATSSLNVTTDNSSGFTISASRVDADATMDLTTDALVNITDKTTWNAGANCASAGNATASTTESNTLQFRIRVAGTDALNHCSAWWGGADTTAAALFAGFPTTDKAIVYRSSAAVVETNAIVLYNVNVAVTQKTGDYTGSITYTAVANP